MRILVLHLFILCSCSLPAQIVWEQHFGGTATEDILHLCAGSDDTFLAVGYTTSDDIDIIDPKGQADGLMILMNESGAILWSKTVGGSSNDQLRSAVQHPSGEWYVAGISKSTDGDIDQGSNNTDQGLLCKFSESGEKLWCKAYGVLEDDEFYTISLLDDDRLLLSGAVDNEDLFISSTVHSNQDFWLVEMDSSGQVIWERKYGGNDWDQALHHTTDAQGNIYITGFSYSTDGDITTSYGLEDSWTIKTDAAGALIWQQSYGGSSLDQGRQLLWADQSLFLAGRTFSNDGIFNNQLIGQEDGFIMELNPDDGSILQQQVSGGVLSDRISALSWSGHYILSAGYTRSDLNGNPSLGGADYWLRAFDLNLQQQWTKTFGGSNEDVAQSILISQNQGLILAGNSFSNDQDVSGNYGGADAWILMYDAVNSTEDQAVKNPAYQVLEDRVLIHGIPDGLYRYSFYQFDGKILSSGLQQTIEGRLNIEEHQRKRGVLYVQHMKQSNLRYSLKIFR